MASLGLLRSLAGASQGARSIAELLLEQRLRQALMEQQFEGQEELEASRFEREEEAKRKAVEEALVRALSGSVSGLAAEFPQKTSRNMELIKALTEAGSVEGLEGLRSRFERRTGKKGRSIQDLRGEIGDLVTKGAPGELADRAIQTKNRKELLSILSEAQKSLGGVEAEKTSLELDKLRTPTTPDRVDLALMAVRGDKEAQEALELMGREPSITQQEIDPYVHGLERGDFTISSVPANIRDEVLAAAYSKDINIVSDSERKQILDRKRMKPVFKTIKDLSERINTQSGLMAKISGSVRRVQARANLDTDVALYMSLVHGFSPIFARALAHTGVLTEPDLQKTIRLFPDPTDSKEIRDGKVRNLEKLFDQIAGVTESVLFEPVGEWSTLNLPFKQEDLSQVPTDDLIEFLREEE